MNASPRSSQYYLDRASISFFMILCFIQFARLTRSIQASQFLIFLGAFCVSGIMADFVSGVVHWAADTWGTSEWPIVGATLIGPFRDHHLDKTGITRHDFAETNGNNCLVSIPVLFGLFWMYPEKSDLSLFFFTLLFGLTLWIFMTNQFHKWSHKETNPILTEWLQKKNLILPPDHHEFHHTHPFATHYCITNGWMNPVLNRIKFFPRLESVITRLTGARPRQEALSKTTPAHPKRS